VCHEKWALAANNDFAAGVRINHFKASEARQLLPIGNTNAPPHLGCYDDLMARRADFAKIGSVAVFPDTLEIVAQRLEFPVWNA
jgi:hypothetical protein